ncbi:two pore domain potassium channel family protein [bacterium LRH843]|nr:two pore domain potassium channel family protein [bacterium LRH843]
MMSLLLLLRYRPVKGAYAYSLRHFTLLVLVYLTILISFSVLYFGLELLGNRVILENGDFVGGSVVHLIEDIVYFSAITLLQVGYGDLVPIGIGRPIAITQALFGYLLPAAFVLAIFNRK